ncbi:MAG TPA: leucyl aminopeptidase [Smithella sp.]|nr:leucyl aminopeptidase [Smithella sp.]HOS14322.1 leucyl aminopeptidase [Smithella sp.]HPL47930.1 leucyl aminopeptidase [Smithella sp.]HQN71067.1 leucyl aminopeptidase [Smithella sp.]
MNVFVKKGMLAETKSQAVILTLFEDGKKLSGIALEIDKKSGGLISKLMADGDFEGKASQVAVAYPCGNLPSKRIALVGLGKQKEFNLEKLRAAFAKVMRHLRGMNVKEASTSVNLNLIPGKKDQIVQAAVEGALLGLYQYTPYKTVGREEFKEMDEFNIIADAKEYAVIEPSVKKAKIIADAVCFVRDMISAPSNEMTPSIMAQKAQEVAKRKNVTCTVLDRKKMQELGMNALLAVASGSQEEPKFIILEYSGGRKKDAPVVLVGKGLTFDSGGISLKPSDKMEEMKTDMSGGAAVMGAIMAAADMQIPLNVVALIPASDNMPSGSAFKPGDILKSYSGKTIEILSTDAEGRLLLADALAYASKFKPEAVIDLATLTGACVVALGDDVIGMLGTGEKLKKEINRAAQDTGELVWELPLWEQYHELIKSDIADYKNAGNRAAGTITAAAFLSKFVGDYPWAHLDIAGPAWADKDKPYIPKGASGIGVRLLVEFLRNRS